MAILNHVICYCCKTCSLDLLQKLTEWHCSCLCEGVTLIASANLSSALTAIYIVRLCFLVHTSASRHISVQICDLSTWISITAYCQDHYFDVITNVVGLAAAVLGDKYYWWIDPAGAILLALYTITNWSGTVMENAGTSFYVISILLDLYPAGNQLTLTIVKVDWKTFR